MRYGRCCVGWCGEQPVGLQRCLFQLHMQPRTPTHLSRDADRNAASAFPATVGGGRARNADQAHIHAFAREVRPDGLWSVGS